MADYQNTAQGLATLGRGGDSTLVHMNPSEVAGLQNLAARNGTSLTVNPNTGMPEAFNLGGLLPMVAGVGLSSIGMSPLMAGLMVGGATAVMQGDIMAGLGAGLGAYGGAGIGDSLNLLGAGGAEAAAAGATTGEVVSDQITQNLTNMNPTITAGGGNAMTMGGNAGFNTGTMGIPNAANVAGTTTYNPIGQKDALGSSITEVAENQAANAYNPKLYQPSYMDTTGQTINTQLAGPPQQVSSYNANVVGPPQQGQMYAGTTQNLQYPTQEQFMGGATQNTVPQQGSFNVGADMSSYTAPQSGFAQVSEDGLSALANRAGNSFNNMGEGIDTLVNRFDEAKNILGEDKIINKFDSAGELISSTTERIPLSTFDMGMKFGLPIAGGVMAGLEPEDFQQESVDMTQFEDRRFRGPDGQLNVEGKTGLNLKDPYGYTAGGYGYAEGGAVEQGMEAAIARNSGVSSMAPDEGMADALARNEGIAYTPPAPVSTPVSTPVSAPNINVGGFSSAPTNLTGGLGALNVNSGTVGQSPDAKAAEDLRKTQVKMMNGYEVPIDFVPASPGSVVGGMGGSPQSHYYDNATSKWVKGQKPGTFRIGGSNGIGNQYGSFSGYGGPAAGVAQYAEGGYLGGGDVNVQGDGMSDDIPANIDNEQPAALSEGEFVVPADVVSHIGNGSSEAGAKEFYGMMDRVRMARTGRKKQSPEIDPERFMPA